MTPREQAQKLAEERELARGRRDFPRADALRDAIGKLGFDVVDTATGYMLAEQARYQIYDPRTVPDGFASSAILDASVHVLYEGHRSDLYRFLERIALSSRDFEVVVTDNDSGEGDWVETLAVGKVRALHLDRKVGWGEARNAAARTSRGAALIFADLSVEPTGDVIGPLCDALEDSSAGICGPWGLTTTDLREFAEAPGPDVDAIEGYLMAARREDFEATGFDPWFRWYRHADLDLSFRIRDRGLRAVVVPVPATRHEHRGWLGVPEADRPPRSKRNFYRFLDHWKDRTDLLVGRRGS
ncbi:MAG: glycosyltransferase [Actinomycetota bacterium]|nr:glycosyltransferase [Actinomycetota bacterium]